MNYFIPTYKSVLRVLLLAPLAIAFLHTETSARTSSIGLLVKLGIMLLLSIAAIWQTRNKKVPAFFLFGILFLIKGVLIFPDKPEYYVAAAKVSFIVFIFPLTLFYASRSPSQKIDNLFFNMCALLVISTLPYHLGLLENELAIEGGKYDMRKYSSEGFLFTGPFENIHNAAVTLTFSSLGLFKYQSVVKKQGVKMVLWCLILLGLIGVYLTYVRTAWVMLFVAGIIILFYNQKSLKKRVRNYGLSVLVAAIVLIVYSQSEVVQMRFNNTNAYGGGALSEGSGRLVFWKTMFDYLGQLDPVRLFFGTGRESGMDYMQSKIDLRLFSHNGFLDILVSSGLIGLLFFLAMMKKAMDATILPLLKAKNTHHHSYAVIFFCMLGAAIFFQSQQFYWGLMLCGLLFGINANERLHLNAKSTSR